jgi:23S rRNA-/tRNA-specific pseudouridylate synthase
MKSFLAILLLFLSVGTSFHFVTRKLLFPRTFSRFSCQTYCPDPAFPQEESLLKPKFRDLPPLIHHIYADSDYTSVFDLILCETNLTRSYVEELISFGSIYIRPPAILGKLLDYSRVLTDCAVSRNTYCRVHVNPKRYTIEKENWSERIYSVSPGKVSLVNKPPGMPTIPTIDNYIENLLHEVSKTSQHPYVVISRIDVGTGGLVPIAENSAASALYNSFLVKNQITKFYKALTMKPLPLGSLKHYFRKKNENLHRNAKPTLLRNIDDGLLTRDPTVKREDWSRVELIIHKSMPISLANLDPTVLQKMNLSNHFDENHIFYENEIELITGRTHQIRLQLAAIGAPILGDSRYLPVSGLTYQGEDTEWKDGVRLFGRESDT